MYKVIIENGYIISIVSGVTNGNITEDEYNTIRQKLKTRKEAPEGKEYRLKDDLTWELVDVPEVEKTDEEEISGDELLDMLEAIR